MAQHSDIPFSLCSSSRSPTTVSARWKHQRDWIKELHGVNPAVPTRHRSHDVYLPSSGASSYEVSQEDKIRRTIAQFIDFGPPNATSFFVQNCVKQRAAPMACVCVVSSGK